MKGFKNSTRTKSGFSFPSKAGFSSSSGKTQEVSYTRKVPRRGAAKFAEGGKVDMKKTTGAMSTATERKKMLPSLLKRTVGATATPIEERRLMKAEGGKVRDSALTGRAVDVNALDAESGGKSPLRPGYKKGGMPFAKKC